MLQYHTRQKSFSAVRQQSWRRKRNVSFRWSEAKVKCLFLCSLGTTVSPGLIWTAEPTRDRPSLCCQLFVCRLFFKSAGFLQICFQSVFVLSRLGSILFPVVSVALSPRLWNCATIPRTSEKCFFCRTTAVVSAEKKCFISLERSESEMAISLQPRHDSVFRFDLDSRAHPRPPFALLPVQCLQIVFKSACCLL